MIKKRFIYIILALIVSVTAVWASSSSFSDTGFFGDRTKLFYDTYDDFNDTNAWPFNTEATNIAFDIKYGSSKTLFSYSGELPKSLVENDKGKVDNKWGTIPYSRNTEYEIDEQYTENRTTLEEYAATNDVDLRLKALLYWNGDGILSDISEFIYKFTSWITYAFISLFKLVILVKNFDITSVLDLQIGGLAIGERLSKLMSDIFIGQTFLSSPFAMLCVVGGLLSIVRTGMDYAKGRGSIRQLGSMLLVFVLAIFVTSVAASNKSYQLAASLHKAAGQIASTAVDVSNQRVGAQDSWTTSGTGDIEAENSANDMSSINKIYVDSQIKNQVGYAPSELASYSLEDWSYNLWKANTPADSTLDEAYSSKAAREGLQAAVVELNNSSADYSIKNNIIQHLAAPNFMAGALSNILVQVIIVMLAIVLWQVAVNCAMGSLELSLSMFGLPIAGPLLFVRDKNGVCEKMAKGILCLSFVGTLKIVIYGLLFTMTLAVVNIIYDLEISNIIATALFLYAMWKYILPKIMPRIEEILNRIERDYAPGLAQARHSMNMGIASGFGKLSNSKLGTKQVADGTYIDEETGEEKTRFSTRQTLLGRMASGAAVAMGGKSAFETDKIKNKDTREAYYTSADKRLAEIQKRIQEADKVEETEVNKYVDENYKKDDTETVKSIADIDISKLPQDLRAQFDEFAILAGDSIEKERAYRQVLTYAKRNIDSDEVNNARATKAALLTEKDELAKKVAIAAEQHVAERGIKKATKDYEKAFVTEKEDEKTGKMKKVDNASATTKVAFSSAIENSKLKKDEPAAQPAQQQATTSQQPQTVTNPADDLMKANEAKFKAAEQVSADEFYQPEITQAKPEKLEARAEEQVAQRKTSIDDKNDAKPIKEERKEEQKPKVEQKPKEEQVVVEAEEISVDDLLQANEAKFSDEIEMEDILEDEYLFDDFEE